MSTANEVARWLQCSILGADHVQHLLDEGLLPSTWSRADVVIMLSHSCDIAARNPEAEPELELIRGQRLDQTDGNCTHGKNPREIHLDSEEWSEHAAVSFSIHDRHLVPRGAALAQGPSAALPDSDRRMLARWVGKRYWREAFPDSFNERLRGIANEMREVMKGEPGTRITGLYVVMSEDGELPDDVDYSFDLIATMKKAAYDDLETREAAQETLDKFAGLLAAVEGIDLDETILQSEAQVSLHDIRFYRRWDYDDLSMRQEDPQISPEPPA